MAIKGSGKEKKFGAALSEQDEDRLRFGLVIKHVITLWALGICVAISWVSGFGTCGVWGQATGKMIAQWPSTQLSFMLMVHVIGLIGVGVTVRRKRLAHMSALSFIFFMSYEPLVPYICSSPDCRYMNFIEQIIIVLVPILPCYFIANFLASFRSDQKNELELWRGMLYDNKHNFMQAGVLVLTAWVLGYMLSVINRRTCNLSLTTQDYWVCYLLIDQFIFMVLGYFSASLHVIRGLRFSWPFALIFFGVYAYAFSISTSGPNLRPLPEIVQAGTPIKLAVAFALAFAPMLLGCLLAWPFLEGKKTIMEQRS